MDRQHSTSTSSTGLSSGVIDMRELATPRAEPQREQVLDLALSIGAPKAPRIEPARRTPTARTIREALGIVLAVGLAGVVGHASGAARAPAIVAPPVIVASPAPEPIVTPPPVVPEIALPETPAETVVEGVAAEPATTATRPAVRREPPSREHVASAVESTRTNEPASLEDLMRAASGAEVIRASHGTTTPALPATPSRDDVRTAMTAVTPAVRACVEGTHGQTSIFVVLTGETGHVRSANVSGDFAGTPEGSCIARAVREAEVPAFSRATFSFTYPFSF